MQVAERELRSYPMFKVIDVRSRETSPPGVKSDADW
jgi:hypothetical protein